MERFKNSRRKFERFFTDALKLKDLCKRCFSEYFLMVCFKQLNNLSISLLMLFAKLKALLDFEHKVNAYEVKPEKSRFISYFFYFQLIIFTSWLLIHRIRYLRNIGTQVLTECNKWGAIKLNV